jgi:hypothetical protein
MGMSRAAEPFISRPDVCERHETLVHAPAELVLGVAQQFDIQSIPLVRATFWLRAKLLRSKVPPRWRRQGLVVEMLGMGWRVLDEKPGRFFVAGAVCQPWRADVVFSPVAADQFAAYAEPDRVKIAWTLEAEALAPAFTRFATETRVAATDEQARAKFRRYWRMFGIGILAIRWLLLPAVRRQAEARWRGAGGQPSS